MHSTNFQKIEKAVRKQVNRFYKTLLLFTHPVVSLQPMDCSTPGLPVPHHLMEFAEVHVHFIADAVWPSSPLMPSSPSALNLFQYQGLFQ